MTPRSPLPDLPEEPEERDPGLAHERTSLAWTRTAISFAAVGGVVLKQNAVTGIIILAVAPVVGHLGRVPRGRPAAAAPLAAGATPLFLITVAIVLVALLCLILALAGPVLPGALR